MDLQGGKPYWGGFLMGGKVDLDYSGDIFDFSYFSNGGSFWASLFQNPKSFYLTYLLVGGVLITGGCGYIYIHM